MLRRRKQVQPEEVQGAPEWMVTFSDCMTLLLTFFVLMLSFSSFDEKVFQKLKMIFGKSFSSISPTVEVNKDAFLSTNLLRYTEELDEGSEKPTLAIGDKDNLKEDTGAVDVRSRKVFLIPSKNIFWGKGTAISFEGGRTLSTMASFLKEVPSRVVISENGQEDNEDNKQLGLLRAWAVMEYLITKQGLDQRQFSISASSTITPESTKSPETSRTEVKTERRLEIVLLERSIYN